MQENKYDIVNRIYQSQGKWTEAFEIAQKEDRVHLRHTYFNYARYLESISAIESAVKKFVQI